MDARTTDPVPATPADHHPIPRWRKVCFAALSVVIVIAVVESILALAGVEPGVVSEDPFVGFQSRMPLFVAGVDESGRPIFQTAPNKRSFFNDQAFLAHKPRSTYRIFCLGGSTTYGRPFHDATSYVGWLRAFLSAAAPDTHWEVVNCGGVSYASYRLAVLMEELINYEPDLFITYTGHNEFLERRTYARMIESHPVRNEFQFWMYRSRAVSLLRHALSGLRDDERDEVRRKFRMSGEVATLLEESAGLDLYHRDERFRKQVIAHYAFNLGRMVTLARSVGAKVVFIDPGANLVDSSPFKSQHREDLPREDLKTWRDLFERGLTDLKKEHYTSALVLLDRAAEIDDRYAELHFRRGRALFHLGRFEEAKEAFIAAEVEDVCPLRMLPSMHGVLASVANEHDVPVVGFAAAIARECREALGHELPGKEHFLDHVHPTIETHRLLGEMLLSHLITSGVVEPAPSWNEKAQDGVAQSVMSSLTDRDYALAQSTLGRVLRWAGKTEEAERLIAAAVKALPDDAPTLSAYATTLKRQGRTEEAMAYYRRALALEPGLVEAAVNLAGILVKIGRYDEAIAHYAAVVDQRPNDGWTLSRLGIALSEAGRFNESEATFLRALRVDPQNPSIHIEFGQSLIRQGRPDEALTHLNTALKSNPRALRALVMKGVALTRLGRIAEAVGQYEEALRLDPVNAQAHYNLGVAFLTTGQEDSALSHFLQAVDADPTLVDAQYNLGLTYARRGAFDRAREHLEQVVALTPDDPEPYYQLGMVLLAKGQFAACVRTLRNGVRIAPDDVNLMERLAWILATAPEDEVRNGPEAVRLAERVVTAIGTASARAMETLAAAYAEVGRFADAVGALERAMQAAEGQGSAESVSRLRGRLEQIRAHLPIREHEDR